MDYKDYLEQGSKTKMHFWYRARLGLLEYLLQKALPDNNLDKKILNIGCGTGTENKVIKKYGQLTALDVNKNALEKINENDCDVLLGDVELVDLEKNHFDLICAFDILEHLRQDDLVIKKIYDSLKSGGKFIFTVPAYKFLYSPHDIALGHQRRYDKQEMERKLKMVGFELVETAYWNFTLFPLEALFRIIKKILYRVIKIKEHKTEIGLFNDWMDKFLYSIMKQDIKLIKKGIHFPFGLTFYGITIKKYR